MSNEPTFDAAELLAELDGGVFNEKLSRALRDVAEGALQNQREGKVNVELKIKQIGESTQVAVHHKLAYVRPTKRGKSSEEDTTSTPLYVGQRGKLTIMPESQTTFGLDNSPQQEMSE